MAENIPQVEKTPVWSWKVLLILVAIIIAIGLTGSLVLLEKGESPAEKINRAEVMKKAPGAPLPETANEPIGSWPWRLVVLGAILLVLTAVMSIPVKFALPGKGLLGLIGTIALVTGLFFVFFPEITSGVKDLLKKESPRQVARSATAAAYAAHLPVNAVFLKTASPGQSVYFTRERMEGPAPQLWAKNLATDQVALEDPWPTGSKHRYLRNPINNNIGFYAVVPAGQGILASYEKPTPDRSGRPRPAKQATEDPYPADNISQR